MGTRFQRVIKLLFYGAKHFRAAGYSAKVYWVFQDRPGTARIRLCTENVGAPSVSPDPSDCCTDEHIEKANERI